VRIEAVKANGRRRAFEVTLPEGARTFPYARCAPAPSAKDPVVSAYVDPELGHEGFTYVLKSGVEGSIHVEQVLDYHRDPAYLRDLLVYRLTLEARDRLETSGLSTREVIRRLNTSATQLYRLLDPTNRTNTLDQMLRLLAALDCEVDVVVHARSA